MSRDANATTEDKDIKLAMKLAAKARKLRKSAPLTGEGSETRIDQKIHMNRMAEVYKERDLEVPHMLFIQRKDLKRYAYDGYNPVLENIGSGDSIEIGTDILIECSEDQYQASLALNSKRSDRVLKSAVKKANSDGGDKYEGKQEVTVSKGSPDGKVDPATTRDLALETEEG